LLRCDFSELDEGWEYKWHDLEELSSGVAPMRVREKLWKFGCEAVEKGEFNMEGDVEILVVSHGGLLRRLEGAESM
jgi:hypothetical protein